MRENDATDEREESIEGRRRSNNLRKNIANKVTRGKRSAARTTNKRQKREELVSRFATYEGKTAVCLSSSDIAALRWMSVFFGISVQAEDLAGHA